MSTNRESTANPYPPIQIEAPNPQYARMMLSNVGGNTSEMTAVALYFYNHLVTEEVNQEISTVFHKISEVEMRHLEIFGSLARKLGADPRLWSLSSRQPVYWTPQYLQYPRELNNLLRNSIKSEEEAIQKYTRQAEAIKDPYIVANLDRIIADEEGHLQQFKQLLSGL